MRILFICGSLAPGKDGVGDYTRRIAGEMLRQGYKCLILSLNDKLIQKDTSEVQCDMNTDVPVIRLTATIPWKVRYQQLRSVINDFKPDWISLQYVSFAFHNKGLPFNLARSLRRAGSNSKWHIMFHELWFGMEENSNLKETIYARLQSYIIFKMLDRLKPVVIHTQTALYQVQLKKRGYPARWLPLFGNIPKVKVSYPGKKNGIAVFGSIYPESQIEIFTSAYVQSGIKDSLPLKLLFIGRNGAGRERWIKSCQEASLVTETLGELSTEQVSEVLQTCIAGISTTPALLMDKSGAVAALREHDLPIIDLARPWKAKGIDTIAPPADLLSIQRFFNLYKSHCLPQAPYAFGLEYTTRLFIQDLHLEPL